MARIKARSAVITGASSGIGAELARQLAAEGVRVGLTARRADRLEALAVEIRRRGGSAVVAPADATDGPETRIAIERMAGEIGPIDLLIANAGVGLGTPAARFSAEVFESLVRVNLIGAAFAIEAVLPAMLDRGTGHLVGISSLAGFRGLPGSSGYCASKAGLTTLLEGLRVELRHSGIVVSTVHPGFVRSPMTEGAGTPQPWLMETDTAARHILVGIARTRRDINFPWQTTALMRLVRGMPAPLYDRLASRLLGPASAIGRRVDQNPGGQPTMI